MEPVPGWTGLQVTLLGADKKRTNELENRVCCLNFLLKTAHAGPTAHVISSKGHKLGQSPVKVGRALSLCFVYFTTTGHFFGHTKIQY